MITPVFRHIYEWAQYVPGGDAPNSHGAPSGLPYDKHGVALQPPLRELRLRDKGNTVLVVEHKPEMIAIADWIIDLDPGAGHGGGRIVFEGAPAEQEAAGLGPGRAIACAGDWPMRGPRSASWPPSSGRDRAQPERVAPRKPALQSIGPRACHRPDRVPKLRLYANAAVTTNPMNGQCLVKPGSGRFVGQANAG